jgi:hypothetical protein
MNKVWFILAPAVAWVLISPRPAWPQASLS